MGEIKLELVPSGMRIGCSRSENSEIVDCLEMNLIRLIFFSALMGSAVTVYDGSFFHNLSYGVHPEQKLDIMIPTDMILGAPLLVWIHGGGWVTGDPSFVNPHFLRMSSEDGYALASLGYRLCNLSMWCHPIQIQDVKAALIWLRSNASETYGFSSEIVGVGGSSAGAHLASLLAVSVDTHLGTSLDQPVNAVVDLYGPTALDDVESFAAGKPHDLVVDASPDTYITNNDPPFWIAHGLLDVVVTVNHSLIFHERLQAAGVPSTLTILPNGEHGGSEFSTESLYLSQRDFFRLHLKAPETEPSSETNTGEITRHEPPCGIFSLGALRAGTYGEGYIKNADFVNGYAWLWTWNEMEDPTVMGNYSFVAVDTVLAALAPGKQLSLLLRTNDPPKYVTQMANETWGYTDLNENQDTFGENFTFPVPWDEFGLDRLGAFLEALSRHQVLSDNGTNINFRDHPAVSTINLNFLGVGSIRELWFQLDSDTIPGYSRSRFIQAILDTTQIYRLHFPNQALVVGFWAVQDDEGSSPPLWQDVADALLAQDNVGFWMENLAASKQKDTFTLYPNTGFAAPLFTYKEDTWIGFQMITSWTAPWGGRDSKVNNTTPLDAIRLALETYGSRYYEVYFIDLQNPEYEEGLRWWNSFLCQNQSSTVSLETSQIPPITQQTTNAPTFSSSFSNSALSSSSDYLESPLSLAEPLLLLVKGNSSLTPKDNYSVENCWRTSVIRPRQ